MQPQRSPSFWHGRSTLVLLGFLAVAGYFLITEHTAHTIAVLPWLFLLACPLMHMFMHHGHHGHGRHTHARPDEPQSSDREGRP